MADSRITCFDNGPLRIEGDFTLRDADGNEFDLAGRKVIGLCRCGQSENKPFCDGRHKAEFASVVKARALPPPAKKA